jgi:hypothetical protein
MIAMFADRVDERFAGKMTARCIWYRIGSGDLNTVGERQDHHRYYVPPIRSLIEKSNAITQQLYSQNIQLCDRSSSFPLA